jgi:hypothetical protein
VYYYHRKQRRLYPITRTKRKASNQPGLLPLTLPLPIRKKEAHSPPEREWRALSWGVVGVTYLQEIPCPSTAPSVSLRYLSHHMVLTRVPDRLRLGLGYLGAYVPGLSTTPVARTSRCLAYVPWSLPDIRSCTFSPCSPRKCPEPSNHKS